MVHVSTLIFCVILSIIISDNNTSFVTAKGQYEDGGHQSQGAVGMRHSRPRVPPHETPYHQPNPHYIGQPKPTPPSVHYRPPTGYAAPPPYYPRIATGGRPSELFNSRLPAASGRIPDGVFEGRPQPEIGGYANPRHGERPNTPPENYYN